MLEINQEQLQAICEILGDTNNGLTKNELQMVLSQCRIEIVDDGSSNDGYRITWGLNKRTWLHACLATEINKSQNLNKVFAFIECALNPVRYTTDTKQKKFMELRDSVNKALLLAGFEIQKSGKLQRVVKATTLDEVNRRVDSLRTHLYNRAIHAEVTKYCIDDFLRKDYYDAVFEAAKGLAERVRNISGLQLDGSELFQSAFSLKKPYVFLNKMETKSEQSEQNGLRELLEAIFHLIRNPVAHTPKINWKAEEADAIEVLTLISFAHKYLDKCCRMPQFKS